jgi:AcrR family transcriptional regulator
MAMLNYYFGSKEGLFLAIFDRKINTFRDLLHDIGIDQNISAWEKIERYIDMYAERVVTNNCFQKMLYQEMAMAKRGELTDKLTGIMMTTVIEVGKILADGIASGEFDKDIDAEMVIATIYGTKNFIINAPHMTTAMLGYDIKDEKNLEDKFKPRIKIYMKKLLKSYLLLHEHEHTN